MEHRKHKKKASIEQSDPNRKLYCTLLVISLLLTIVFIFIPQSSSVFTIGTGIGCGGIASTIVAWLIDEANSKRDKSRIAKNRDILFSRLFAAFDNGLQLLIISIFDYIHGEDSRNWYEWTELAYTIAKRNPNYYKDYNTYIRMLFDEILEQAAVIESQTATLLEHGFVKEEDIASLSLIISSSSLAKNELASKGNDAQITANVRNCCTAIELALSNSPSMCFINKKTIEPKILNVLKKRNSDS